MDEQQIDYYAETPMPARVLQEQVQIGHDRFPPGLLSGQLTAKATALQPLHVGLGQLWSPKSVGLEAETSLVKVFFRSGTDLVIPGTSLKGAVRSLVEMITASCAPVPPKRGQGCVFDANRQQDSLCPACRMFGAMGYQGGVRFRDSDFPKGTKRAIVYVPPQYGPRAIPGSRRYYPHELQDPRTATWPLEVVETHESFKVVAQFTNLTYAELGLLLVVLGADKEDGDRQKLCLKLGAGKSSGLGATVFEKVRLKILNTAASCTSAEVSWQPIKIPAYLEAAQAVIRQDVLARVREDLAYSNVPGAAL